MPEAHFRVSFRIIPACGGIIFTRSLALLQRRKKRRRVNKMWNQQGGEKTIYKRPIITINGKQYLISRVTMEKALKRKLLSTELIHHIDKNPSNNNLSNLAIVSRSEHKKIHSDIGKNTRLKKKYYFNKNEIISLYFTLKSAIKIARLFDCHVITIERFLRNVLKINKLKNFRRQRGWKGC